MGHYIVDGMKKEGRVYLVLIVLGYAMSILQPLAILYGNIPEYTDADAFKRAIAFFLLGSWGLYCYLYAIKYRIEITQERIVLVTLFGKKELCMPQITEYSCKRHGKSVFYVFKLRTQRKKVSVSTRYRKEFGEILKQNGISEQC